MSCIHLGSFGRGTNIGHKREAQRPGAVHHGDIVVGVVAAAVAEAAEAAAATVDEG